MKKYINVLFTKIKVTQIKNQFKFTHFCFDILINIMIQDMEVMHMKISSCASSGHVRLFTSLLKKSYPDLAPNIPPDPPPDLGDEARPLRGIFTSSIKT